MIDKMAIKDQVSATEQMKKIDDIQESHMVGGWGEGEEREEQLRTQAFRGESFFQPPKSLVTRLRKGVLGSTEVLIHVR